MRVQGAEVERTADGLVLELSPFWVYTVDVEIGGHLQAEKVLEVANEQAIEDKPLIIAHQTTNFLRGAQKTNEKIRIPSIGHRIKRKRLSTSIKFLQSPTEQGMVQPHYLLL